MHNLEDGNRCERKDSIKTAHRGSQTEEINIEKDGQSDRERLIVTNVEMQAPCW